MTKAVIYTRFSPRKDEDESESCEYQAEFCQSFSATRTYDVVLPPFEDRALSGADHDRPGLWNAIAALKRGYVLVVYKFDRLARDAFLAMTIERDVLKRGASIVSASGEGTIDAALSPEDRLRIGVLRLFAEYERHLTRSRTKAAMRRHQSAGRRMSDVTPYGFMNNPENPALMISNDTEQLAVASAIAHRKNGKGLREICRQLATEGHACRGGQWQHRTVKAILRRAGVD